MRPRIEKEDKLKGNFLGEKTYGTIAFSDGGMEEENKTCWNYAIV